ncbi:DUF3040 domain-containing protein [Pseudonocardia dioxanivorans]|uniref:DUF3040 domain-containing protein n=1 Tax=Pseudonocardia dioxanivorans TaxID=240495 RepID=UPI00131A5C0D|nr:DUF3040 domain-containing protein [Pseudonocardia dioxanivorans]
MLDDHERRTLQDLERQLMAEDVEFSRSFRAHTQHLGRKHLGVAATVAMAVVIVLCALMVMAGSPVGALAFAALSGVLWLARWGARRREDRDRR